MRNGVIIILLVILTGCASTQDVINTVPQAIGTVAGAAVFGGTVSMNPDPEAYVKESVNREGRIIYGDTRRKTTQSITYMIQKMFEPTK